MKAPGEVGKSLKKRVSNSKHEPVVIIAGGVFKNNVFDFYPDQDPSLIIYILFHISNLVVYVCSQSHLFECLHNLIWK